MITVPCCGPCNAEKKQVDDFLRDYLVAIIDEHPNEIAEAIKTGKLQRAVDRGQSKLHKELGAADQIMALNGTVVDLEPILVVPLRKYMRFAVKGIFDAKANMRIPEDHKLMVGRIDGLPGLDSYYEKLGKGGPVNGVRIGDQRVFGCICQSITSRGRLEATFWAMIFYNRTFISCMTASPLIIELLPQEIQSDFV